MQNHGDNQSHLHAAPFDGEEKRREHRKRTLKQGRVVLSDSTAIDCNLRDLSEHGARVVFAGAVSLPEEFRLYNVSDKMMAPVRLKWQRGLEAGVEFLGPLESHTDF